MHRGTKCNITISLGAHVFDFLFLPFRLFLLSLLLFFACLFCYVPIKQVYTGITSYDNISCPVHTINFTISVNKDEASASLQQARDEHSLPCNEKYASC